MRHPWEEIPLEDYEKHMKLEFVLQLQALNEIMKSQLEDYPVSRIMILGIAGGNGLEHIRKDRVKKVYGVDINAAYLEAAAARHPELVGVLECLRADLTEEPYRLPEAELVVADLLVEYIGYERFQEVIRHVRPAYVSCVIQVDGEERWVSDSPYLHTFDRLERVHHPVEREVLREAIGTIGYRAGGAWERGLPNGKSLVRMDFAREDAP